MLPVILRRSGRAKAVPLVSEIFLRRLMGELSWDPKYAQPQIFAYGKQGRSDGEYIGIYTPRISNRFVHVWDINTCFEIAMTS